MAAKELPVDYKSMGLSKVTLSVATFGLTSITSSGISTVLLVMIIIGTMYVLFCCFTQFGIAF